MTKYCICGHIQEMHNSEGECLDLQEFKDALTGYIQKDSCKCNEFKLSDKPHYCCSRFKVDLLSDIIIQDEDGYFIDGSIHHMIYCPYCGSKLN